MAAMNARAWEQPPSSPRTRVPDDRAVSPVVGMILVLGISIVGTASILYWGLPAIDEMKANVEYRSVEGQFGELDATLKELVAGTTAKTAKRWQPSINRGEVLIRNGTEGWLFATDTYNASVNHDVGWSSFADGDNRFTLHNMGVPLNWYKVECHNVTGTSSLTALNVSVSAASDDQMLPKDEVWPAGTTKDFHLWVKDAGTNTPVPIQSSTFKCRLSTGISVVAEAWYANLGRIDYALRAGMGEKRITENNGALLEGGGSSWAITNSPSLPPATTTGGVHRFFGRSLVLFGNASFAGEDRFDLLVSLYSTAILASYDCAAQAKTDCVETSKIYVFGDLKDPWYAYLTNTGQGYTFQRATLPGTTVEYLVDRPLAGHMGYTLLQSTVLMAG